MVASNKGTGSLSCSAPGLAVTPQHCRGDTRVTSSITPTLCPEECGAGSAVRAGLCPAATLLPTVTKG